MDKACRGKAGTSAVLVVEVDEVEEVEGVLDVKVVVVVMVLDSDVMELEGFEDSDWLDVVETLEEVEAV